MTDFARTLRTAKDADEVTALLERAARLAGRGLSIPDASRLLALADRYRTYATALRETAAGAEEPDEPDLNQALLEI